MSLPTAAPWSHASAENTTRLTQKLEASGMHAAPFSWAREGAGELRPGGGGGGRGGGGGGWGGGGGGGGGGGWED